MVNNEYSIKVDISGCNNNSITFTGKFKNLIETKISGFQSMIMTMIEYIIRQVIDTNFNIGELPKLGRPPIDEIIFKPNDIVVSFADNNDYFVFNVENINERIVCFYTLNELKEAWTPDNNGMSQNTSFTFDSSDDNVIYTVEYTQYGEFTISDNRGRSLIYNNGTVIYNGDTLNQTLADDGETLIYKSINSDIGVTVLPNMLPQDQTQLMFAEGIPGLFYRSDITSEQAIENIIQYITVEHEDPGNPFTTRELKYIELIVRMIFNPVRNSIDHIIDDDNRSEYSNNNGFKSISTIPGLSIEICIS